MLLSCPQCRLGLFTKGEQGLGTPVEKVASPGLAAVRVAAPVPGRREEEAILEAGEEGSQPASATAGAGGGGDDQDRKFLLLTLFLPLPMQLDQKPEGWWSLLSPHGDPPRRESRMEVGEE